MLIWNFLVLQNIMMDVATLQQHLAAHGQEHLLKYWDVLTESQKKSLYNDLIEYVLLVPLVSFPLPLTSFFLFFHLPYIDFEAHLYLLFIYLKLILRLAYSTYFSFTLHSFLGLSVQYLLFICLSLIFRLFHSYKDQAGTKLPRMSQAVTCSLV